MTTAEPVAATTPARVREAWAEALNRGDIEGMLALYTADAAFVADETRVIRGADGIRGVLRALVAFEGAYTFTGATVIEQGDIALCHARWTLSGTSLEGPLDMGGYTSDVVQRLADGTWKYVIDDLGTGR